MKKAWIFLFLFLFIVIPIVEAQVKSSLSVRMKDKFLFFVVVKPGQQAGLYITVGNEEVSTIPFTPYYKIYIATTHYASCPQTYDQWLGNINFDFTLTHGDISRKGTIDFYGSSIPPGGNETQTVIIDTPLVETDIKTIWIVVEDKDTGEIRNIYCEVIEVHEDVPPINWLLWGGLGAVITVITGASIYIIKRKHIGRPSSPIE